MHPCSSPAGRTAGVIRLPNGNSCRLDRYVSAWRAILQLPADQVILGFGDWPMEAGRVLAELRVGLADRINRHLPGYGQGRKWSADWQAEAARLARAVNTPRLVVRWIPLEFRSRFAHRLEA